MTDTAKMDAATLKALKASIRKWRKNCNAKKPSNVRMGVNDCALCMQFVGNRTRWRNDPHLSCAGCPIMGNTGLVYCGGTPYEECEDNWNAWEEGYSDGGSFKASAIEMTRFLESLLPEGETV